MKRYLINLAAIFCFTSACAQNYKVTLQANQYSSGIAYLTYHMGKNLAVEDSAAVTSKGVAVFSGKKKLLPGIYALVLPGQSKVQKNDQRKPENRRRTAAGRFGSHGGFCKGNSAGAREPPAAGRNDS